MAIKFIYDLDLVVVIVTVIAGRCHQTRVSILQGEVFDGLLWQEEGLTDLQGRTTVGHTAAKSLSHYQSDCLGKQLGLSQLLGQKQEVL